MKHIITTMLLAATCCVASGQTSDVCAIVRDMNEAIAVVDHRIDALIKSRDYWRNEALEGDERCKRWMALYDSCSERDSDTSQRYAELFVKYANLLNEPRTVTQSCQRTHCDTPWPYGIVTNSGPYILPNAVLPYILPNTWPGTFTTNYVTNINANVEKED